MPLSAEEVREAILSSLEPGFDLWSDLLHAAIERLLLCQPYKMKVGNDLNSTTDLLMNLV